MQYIYITDYWYFLCQSAVQKNCYTIILHLGNRTGLLLSYELLPDQTITSQLILQLSITCHMYIW